MRLLLSWARDFVDVTAPPQAVADLLALRGFEVASVEPVGSGDAVIDFEVTANRPDCLSVLGLAREIATAYDLPLKQPSADASSPAVLAPVAIGENDAVRVTIEDAERCPRYAAAVAEVTPAVTPAWMAARLEHAGVRPISALVDITNYVLMEIGHPMHAFDRDTLAGQSLAIRVARPGETIQTLDGVKRTLDPEMLVIADAQRPQAIAGVMGGATSEVSARTRTIVFESAYFQPVSVRRTSKRLGLKTEASSRFERGADVNAPVAALQRAIALMQAVGAGRLVGPVVDRYPTPRGPAVVPLRRSRLAAVLGLTVPDADVERILRALGLSVAATADGWRIEAPTFRVDLTREVDLIEEVGRHYGLERLEPSFPPVTSSAPPPDPRIPRDDLIRRVLTAAGLSEAVTFGTIEAKAAALFVTPEGAEGLVAIANPLSAKFDTLRASLLPGLVDAVAHNRRHGRRDVGLFEIGARFSRGDGETRGVGMAWTGAATAEHWSGAAREVDFFDLKGLVETLGQALHVELRIEPARPPFLVAGQAAVLKAGAAEVGVLGLVAPAIVEERGAPRQDKVFAAELNLDRLAEAAVTPDERFVPLPRYPSVVRDLSIVVSDALPAAIIRGTVQAAGADGTAPLVAVAFFDRYAGAGIPSGTVSVSVRLTFQAPDRTLTDTEVQHTFDRIVAALVREHGATQR